MFLRKIATFFVLVALVGCSSSKNPYEKIARVNLKDEPHTLDPRRARDPGSLTLARTFFEGLTRIGRTDAPELALAKSVEISGDLTTYTFTLRDALWTNGDSVRSNDFAYAWKSALDPSFPSDNAFQLYVIKNAKAIKQGELAADELGALTPNEHTLIVELEYPTPYFLELLAFPIFYPIHEQLDRQNPNWALKVETYVSNGPFSLAKWRHHDEIVAKKNCQYWDSETVQLDGISLVMVEEATEMRLFEKGKLHWAGSPLSTLPVDALPTLFRENLVNRRPCAETCFLRTNIDHPALSHPKLRRALALALDRASITEHVLQGGQQPALSLTPPTMRLQKDPFFSDGVTTEARSLFKEALADLGQLPPLHFTYIAQERSHLIAQAIQDQWRQALGIEITLEALERKVYFDRISHADYDLALCSWGADFNDPINFLEVFKYKAKSTNNTGWEDKRYIQLLSESHRQIDPQKRLTLLAKSEAILMKAMPIIPLYHYTMLYRSNDTLQGVFLSSLGHLDFKWATIQNEGHEKDISIAPSYTSPLRGESPALQR